ncbi:SDR family NAD(P)-dependent oxidoreductase [Apilactobacillus micheneri]|uniref:SDR family NAD(P)-dependent oxidoreductase n=1 Tax=Apilactobacillus micheneri TaxID=1899430 RepID=A0ABY2YV55_9LACO|nr:SDR family oxidoreductase [Apilactobacillus micheneri]TPR22838.1 SDR family NAD(P)-dependent oxidoreductase [Apilactobacillus micheneri]TPR24410.1 SDR family NAD(P)-dependent oxidoreductase [Apilactobacillus micheneri]TPR27288.1 SDR family NAD(P)-dependent oxidoreductase [Apilactobacillus micheneri]TPR28670.1 SDR family NAD(P)-dependent oxidoreductase [Apilactobacillus micheneri]TPR28730.1 SDR family NAD(P)-dependent oxidoreductase [Apilactobacillus micheneri]
MVLKNKVIVITGASSGMGAATTKKAIAKGAKVVIGARNEEKLKAIADSTENPSNVIYKTTDVTSLEDVKALVKTAIDKFGKVDIIYNNAGIMPQDNLVDSDPESWKSMFNTNVIGVLNGIKATLPIMKNQGKGLIMATDSVAGHVVYPGSAVYNSTKFAVRAIMEGLRQEEHGNGIKTGIISPGSVNTNLSSTIGNKQIKESITKMWNEKNMSLSAEDIANSAIFMMEQADHVDINEILVRPTGQDI